MPNTQKVAITMPINLVQEIDSLSKRKGVSRSKYISLAISEKIEDEKKIFLKETYDRVFSDKDIQTEQLEMADSFELVGSESGQEW